MKLTFVNGFPDNVSMELQQVENILTVSMSELLSRATILAPGKPKAVSAAAVKIKENSGTRTGESWSFKGQCYRFGGPHMIRFCKEKKGFCATDVGRTAILRLVVLWNPARGKKVEKSCRAIREMTRRGCCASSHPVIGRRAHMSSGRLPVIEVDMGGVVVNVLVDTGCTMRKVRAHLIRECERDEKETYMVAFDGRQVRCCGTCRVKLVVSESQVEVHAVVVDEVVEGIDMVMGIDVIDRLGGGGG